MEKKLSVVVPIYNVDKYLEKCVNSILNQTYKNIEIILVDDGSTDNSGKICDRYKEKYTNIIVIHKKNGGLSSARNAGIDAARGEYISFIDADDYINFKMYKCMIEAMERTGKMVSSCGRIVNVYGNHENIEYTINKECEFTKEESIKNILHFTKIDVSACDKVYKLELFKNIRYPEGKISEDAAIIFELLDNSNGIVHVGQPFYHYIFRKKSISKSEYSIKNFDVLLNLDKTRNYINDKYKELNNDFKIYACITSAAQLLLLNEDKSIKKKYLNHYNRFIYYFNLGYKETIKLKEICKKEKLKLFCLKHRILFLYILIKKIYQIIYIIK